MWGRCCFFLFFFYSSIAVKPPSRLLQTADSFVIQLPSLAYFCWQAPVIIAGPERRHFIFNLKREKILPLVRLNKASSVGRCCSSGAKRYHYWQKLLYLYPGSGFHLFRLCKSRWRLHLTHTHTVCRSCSKVNQVAGSGTSLQGLAVGNGEGQECVYFSFSGHDTLCCPHPSSPRSVPLRKKEINHPSFLIFFIPLYLLSTSPRSPFTHRKDRNRFWLLICQVNSDLFFDLIREITQNNRTDCSSK